VIGRLARRLIPALALLAASIGGTAAARKEPDPPAPATADPSRQVLVMLRLPPQHLRPGGDYGDAYDDGQGRAARLRIAERLAREHGLILVTSWPMAVLGVDCYVFAVPEGVAIEDEAARLSHDPGVAWTQPMHLYHARGGVIPNDPLFRFQPAASRWRLADLHEMSTGRGALVAVIDSQIDATHPDLLGQIRISRDFAPGRPSAGERHGTGVAGVIAARADNGVGIVGVAPQAKLIALRACWQPQPTAPATVCDSLTLAEALHFALEHGADVINLSLSGPPDPLLARLIDVAIARGAVVVGAFDAAAPDGGFPASHAGVVAVSDVAVEGAPPGLYTAPGRDIPTTQPGGRWSLVNGSSYAAAHVSGLMALMHGRAANSRESRGRVLVAARSGGGAIDACATLLRALGACDCACAHEAHDRALPSAVPRR
jgi:hypothetical protein